MQPWNLFLRRLFQVSSQPRQDQTRRGTAPKRRLRVEPLEDRVTPALLGIGTTIPLSFPAFTFNDASTTATSYDAAADTFTVQTAPSFFRLTSTSTPVMVTGTRSLVINAGVDGSGNLIGGVPGDDFVLTGNVNYDGVPGDDATGVLLTGEITQFGHLDSGGTTDYFDFRFTVTGGAMASFFSDTDIGIALTSELSGFTGSFQGNFGGKAKGNVGGIPKLDELPSAQLGDYVWLDTNRNGQQDGGEPGIPGVTVNLLDSAGTTILSTTTTNASGLYGFTVTPGTYVVQFVTPAGAYDKFTTPNTGSDITDSDASPTTGKTGTYTLVSGETNNTIDAGLLPIDLELAKSVDNTTPTVGSNVVFTLTLTNNNAGAGVSTATGVTVKDVLPAGLTYVSSSASQGSYSNGTGIWTVGTMAPGATVTLQITATVTTGGTKTNYAQVTAAGQLDVDSTPNNNPGPNPNEDDEAAVSLNPPAQLGDYVWLDTNRNGQQDGSEPGISGVTVNLLNSAGTTILQTTTTNASGLYGFTVAPGTYVVQFVTPAGAYDKFTSANVGADATDSDASPTTGKTGTYTLVSGETNNTIDAGLLPIDLELAKSVDNTTPTVGSNVTFTLTLTNNNAGAGVSTATGVTVKDVLPAGLTYVSSSASQGSYSNGTGIWTVGTMAPGATVTLSITATVTTGGTKTNYAQVTAAGQLDVDSTPNNNPGPNPNEDDEAAVSLNPPAQLGDYVWLDTNRNGQQDGSEPGISGVTVNLLNSAGTTILQTTTTNASGLYGFTVTPGTYVVQFVTPAGAYDKFTSANVGADATDSDASPTTGKTGTYTLVSGETNNTIDAGLLPIDLELAKSVDNTTPTVGSNVTFTLTLTNNNAGAGVSTATGVTVKDVLPAGLTYVSSSASQGSYSNGTGIWTVGTMAPGATVTLSITATVTTGGTKTNYAQVTAAGQLDVDSTPNNNPGPNPNEDDEAAVSLNPPAQLGDYVWLDTNRNGQQDGSEPGISGVTVNLLNSAGTTILQTTTTNASGLYGFTVTPGTYVVQFVTPAGAYDKFTTPNTGSDITDSDASPTTGKTGTYTLVSGETNNTIDAGLLPIDLELAKSVDNTTPTVGSNVTFTLTLTNNNAGAGVSTATGVTVKDVLPAGLTYVSSSASQGSYSNGTNLWSVGTMAPGATVTLQITATVTTGGTKTNYAQVTAAGQLDVDSTPNNNPGPNPNEDDEAAVSLNPPAQLGDYVWLDTNRNGQQDGSEPGISGVTVNLLNSAGTTILQTTTTNASGLYGFTVTPGTYVVQFVTPAGAYDKFTSANVGADATDSDASPTTGKTGTYTLVSGETNNTIDAGLLPIDLELAKSVDNTTPTVGSNVTFTLTLTNNNAGAGVSTATGVTVKDVLPAGLTYVSSSASQGSYSNGTGIWTVGTMAPGATVTLSITATVTTGGTKTNYAQVTAAGQLDVDSTPNNNPGPNPNEDDEAAVSLNPPAQLGDYVWLDTNRNGQQDGSEPGISGVTVNLLNSAGTTILQTTTTNASGLYGFTVTPGTYVVQFVTPAGAYDKFTTPNTGSDITDSDASPTTGKTGTYTLVSGETNNTIDAGLLPIDLELAKSVDNTTPTVGSNVTFTLTLTNNNAGAGVSTATGVTVKDVLPAGLTYVSSSASQGSYSNGTNLWSVGTMAPGATVTLQITATVTTGGTKTNYAQVTAAGQLDVDSTPNNNPGPNPNEDDEAAVSLNPPAQLGDYVWLDTNRNGQQDGSEPGISGVTVNLLNSAGTTILQTTTTNASGLYGFTVTPGTYVVQFVTPAGAYDKFTSANVGADATDSDASPTTGKTGTYTLVSGETNNTIDAGLLPIDLELAKSVDNTTPTVGSNVTFTLTLTNNNAGAGVSTATGVTVKDVLPAGLTYVSSSASQGSYSNGTGIWTVGTMAPGATVTLSITATVTTGGTKTNYAQVTAAGQLDVDSTPNNNPGPNPNEDDEAAVSLNPPAQLGDYVWLDTNRNGQQDGSEPGISGVTVNLLNSAGTTILQTTTTNASGLYGFTVTPGTYVVQFVTPAGAYDKFTTPNTGSDITDSDASPTTGKTGTYTLVSGETNNTIDAGLLPIDLELAKSVDNTTPTVGSNVTFTLTLTNNNAGAGVSTATGVTVKDVLPAGLTYVSDDGSGAFNSGTGVWTVGTLAPGASVTLHITATVTTGGTKTNYAQVTAAGQLDVDSTPNNNPGPTPSEDDEAAVSLNPGTPQINIVKKTNGVDANTAATAPEIAPGGLVTWTYEVTNTGTVAFTKAQVVVVDDAGTPGNMADDFSTTSGAIVLQTATDVGSDNILSPGETWTFKATGTAQNLTSVGSSVTITTTGSSGTTGTAGNIRPFSAGGVSVNTSGFSRTTGGTWQTAYLGAYGSGLGVTDTSEDGSDPGHTVDNSGRLNYVLYEFSQSVMVDSAFLGYVVGDSDLTAWIGTIPNAFTSHVTLSDAVLTSLGFTEVSDGGSSTRTADINASGVIGNVLVLAAKTTDMDDNFKIQNLVVKPVTQGVYENTAVVTVPGASDSDIDHYKNPPAQPGIRIVKLTNGQDANTVASAAEIAAGGVVTWTYQVANTGNVPFASAQVVVVDDAGTTGTMADDFSTTSGAIVLNPLSDVGDDGILSPGETWTYTATGVAQNLTALSPSSVTIPTTGSSGTTGTAGNIRPFSAGGISVNTSAFSRTTGGIWATAYLGAYDSGLGVTDTSEDGSSPNHAVDNNGRLNYVLYEFSQPVMVDSVYLGYVSGDSDLTAWIGTIPNAFTSHATLSDAVLGGLGFIEVNSGGSSARTANINAGSAVGNVLVIAAKTTETNDYFKIQNLIVKAATLGTYENTAVAIAGGAADSDLSHYRNPTATFSNPASIAGSIYADANNNGVRDAGEVGIAGATVTLTGTATPVPVSRTATTAADGSYSFTGLPAGTYSLTESTQPPGYTDGTDKVGTAGGTAGNDVLTGIVLAASTNATGYLFGEKLASPGSLSGFVYKDTNNNGAKDGGESGISGVTVKLFDSSNQIVAITTTTGTGAYTFTGIAAGTYLIVESQPAGYTDGKDTFGTGVTNLLLSNDSLKVKVAAGQSGVNYNFGEMLP